MENVIELALLAVAAYGVKRYFFSAEPLRHGEVFSSRAATLVKRVVNAQAKKSSEINLAPSPEQLDEIGDQLKQSEEPIAIVTSDILKAPETQSLADESEPSAASIQSVAPEQENANPFIPEDSILKRHYLGQMATERTNITNPYPTDSVLIRHYQQRHLALLDLPANEPIFETSAGLVTNEPDGQTLHNIGEKPSIPEDSVLKRHVLSAVRYDIENQYPPCPSDAVLKRHYLQLIQSKIDIYLSD